MNPAWVAFWGVLAGAVIGAAASIITTRLVQKDARKRRAEEWEWEERTRFHQDRVRCYADFQRVALELHSAKESIEDASVDLQFLQNLRQRFVESAGLVVLLASKPVADSASKVLKAMRSEQSLRDEEVGHLLAEFQWEARKELGVAWDDG